VIFRKIEYGARNAAIEAAKRSWAENLCNVRVNKYCAPVRAVKAMVALGGVTHRFQ
jgi:hypothetical protein